MNQGVYWITSELFQSEKWSNKNSVTQPQNLNPSGDKLKSAISVILVDLVTVMIPTESLAPAQLWLLLQPSKQTQKRFCQSCHVGGCSLDWRESPREMKTAVLVGAWLENWRQELAESASKRLSQFIVCVVSSWEQIKLSQILWNLQELKFGSDLRVYVTISHWAFLLKGKLELTFYWKGFQEGGSWHMVIFLTPKPQVELRSVQWRSVGSWQVVTVLSPRTCAGTPLGAKS